MPWKMVNVWLITCGILQLCFTQHIAATNENLQQVNIERGRWENLKNISIDSERFALELFQKLSTELSNYQYDFMISPFSVWSLLILVMEGAKGNTLLELQKVMRINSQQTNIRDEFKAIQRALKVNTTTIEVSTLQAIFTDINRPVEREFEDIIERLYEAKVVPVNFHSLRAQHDINTYVNKNTHGLITDVVKGDDLREAQMVMISAIFYKGQWTHPFNSSLTREDVFYDEDGNVVGRVNMMFQRGNFNYAGVSELESNVLELPYGKENRLSMIIIFPKKGVSVTSVVQKLMLVGTAKIFDEIKKNTYINEDSEVEVYLPKFTTTTDLTLNVILEQMGILDLFDATKADLSKITSENEIYLSRLFHKTKIEVTEEGTIATAVTGGVLANKAQLPRFYLNRPFAYLIIESSTNSILFCGQIRKPGKKT